MNGAGLDEIAELGRCVELLSQRDRRGDGFSQTAMAIHIVEIDRLFNPRNVEIHQTTGGLDRLRE